MGVLGLDVVGGDLGDQEREERGADDDPDAELGGSRQPELAAGAARASSLGSRHSLMLRVRSPAVRAGRRLTRCGVTTDDGVSLATRRDRRSGGARAAPPARHRRRQGGLRGPSRRARAATIGSSPSTIAGTARATSPTTPRAYSLDRLAVDTPSVADAPRPARPAHPRSLDGRHGDAAVPARAPGPRDAVVFMDTSAGAPPGSDTELVAAASRGRAHRWPGGAQAAVGRARPARARRRTSGCSPSGPASREYADYKWHAQSPVMWTDADARDRHPARPAGRARRRSRVPDARDRGRPGRDVPPADGRHRGARCPAPASSSSPTPGTHRSSRTRRRGSRRCGSSSIRLTLERERQRRHGAASVSRRRPSPGSGCARR